jgi:hypothetical protein
LPERAWHGVPKALSTDTRPIRRRRSIWKDVMTFAPSSSSVKELKKQGFAQSNTIQTFMRNTLLQGECTHGLLGFVSSEARMKNLRLCFT